MVGIDLEIYKKTSVLKWRIRMTEQKPWYKSKGQIGGLLVVGSGILSAVGLFLQGQLDITSALSTIVPLVGTGLGIIGVRRAL